VQPMAFNYNGLVPRRRITVMGQRDSVFAQSHLNLGICGLQRGLHGHEMASYGMPQTTLIYCC
jgi:hypothetical protein